MTRIHVKQADEALLYDDGSVDSTLTRSAASMLESVEAYLAEHPDLQGWGRMPARGERNLQVPAKMKA